MGKVKKGLKPLGEQKWENSIIWAIKKSAQNAYKLQAFEKGVYNIKQSQGSARTF